MSLNDIHMLPTHVRKMRQMNDLLDAEDLILQEIEKIIDEIYLRASMLHEELVNEPWLEQKLKERTGATANVTAYAEDLLVRVVLEITDIQDIDAEDVRRFLDKWLPAHLQYKLNLLQHFLSEIPEEFFIDRMSLGVYSLFWKTRTLDGTWILDGEFSLGSVRQENPVGITYEAGVAENTEEFAHSMRLKTGVRTEEGYQLEKTGLGIESFFWKAKTLNGTWLLDGETNLTEIWQPMDFGQVFGLGNLDLLENISMGGIFRKDLWLLDGDIKLNGTRILDAKITREEL